MMCSYYKAFDTVPHDDLICKLKRFGLEENSLAWLTNYLTNRTQAVCVEDELSRKFHAQHWLYGRHLPAAFEIACATASAPASAAAASVYFVKSS